MSCSNILNDYDGVRHNYTCKGGLVWQEVFLPDNAPAEWADRSVLWNAVEAAETTKESRLARMFVVALPVELNHDQQTALLTEYIRQQFVADGMCADVALHDPDPPGHNPHAHILLTMRPLDEQGDWQYRTEKEYLCVLPFAQSTGKALPNACREPMASIIVLSCWARRSASSPQSWANRLPRKYAVLSESN